MQTAIRSQLKGEICVNIQSVVESLKSKQYSVTFFASSTDAADYLEKSLQNRVIGFGDSATLKHMKLYERLSLHNTVYDPAQSSNNHEFLAIARKCLTTDIYFTSVNAMSESGELINIDGTGNRIAGSLFGHEKVYFIISTNKIEPTLEQAIWRARHVAAPQNAKRYQLNTPCAQTGDHCYDCSSLERTCNALTIYWGKMCDMDAEVVLIDEELGF